MYRFIAVPTRMDGTPEGVVLYAADVTGLWARHVLHEGQAAGLFPIDGLPRPMEPVVVALLERYHDQERSESPGDLRG